MNLRLFAARLYLPAGLQKRKLESLLALTARAFNTVSPSVNGLPLREMRRVYAEFSRAMAELALSRRDGLEAVERRLFEGAERLGREIAGELRIATPREVMAAARVLYRGLEIDLAGRPSGEIVVRRCSFSREYSPEVCRLMSRLDAGVLSGLAGGGELVFTERLTEGAGCCRARFTLPGAR
ncbi:MAG TPA: hypothetical protein VLJ16_03105 [Acidobacteriota bacterium]|nr:hypothetical protein [Acidobacteriota bacterium]